ncbi:hypothetical protein KVT40_007495 [Elsinoe batatas]|uniref:Phytocyanin domain-containing protein n=1 Tax=Elsinoe batatas TaxID=2601811 RepID=A0A8K0L254_9PEZI|nr:hypothetical protein KVT40_007495 [Elsinoe batatas]
MKFSQVAAAVVVALPSTLAQQVYDVTTTSLRFEPASISNVQVGDRIRVTFMQSHDIITSSFNNPCQPASGDGIVNSGVLSGGDVFEFTVNSTDTAWFYCSVARHCNAGPMVFGINPSGDQTLEAVEQKASSNAIQPATAADGTGGLVNPPASSSSSASPSASGSSTPSSSSASRTASGTASGTAASTSAAATGAAGSFGVTSTLGGAAALLWAALAL